MCLDGNIKFLKQKQITCYKVVEKVPGGYRPIFDSARDTDGRQYISKKTYKKADSYEPFHAVTELKVAKRFLRILTEGYHCWVVPHAIKNFVIVKVILKGNLQSGRCIDSDSGVTGDTQFIVEEVK